jgi:hypothetical protein
MILLKPKRNDSQFVPMDVEWRSTRPELAPQEVARL